MKPGLQQFRSKICLAVSLFLAALAGTSGCAPEQIAEPVAQNRQQSTAGATALEALPAVADVSEHPTIAWDVDWEITRERPGYPLLDNVEHFQVHQASVNSGAYHHHPQIVFHHDKFYAFWSNHPSGEDGPGQQVIGAASEDAMNWKFIGVVFQPQDKIQVSIELGRSLMASPCVIANDRLYAVAVINDSTGYGTFAKRLSDAPLSLTWSTDHPKKLRRAHGFALREIGPGGMGPVFWIGKVFPDSKPGFEALPSAKQVGISKQEENQILHLLKNPFTLSPWDFESPVTELEASEGNLLCEPAIIQLKDGMLARCYRDLGGSQKMYAQFSSDNGNSWSSPTITPIPDAPSKSVIGRLPTGEVFIIGNQVVSKRGTRRDPLTIGIANQGLKFDRAFAVRWRTPKFQVASQQTEHDGRGRGFQYPSVLVHGEYLWVVYSVNKEAIEISRIPIAELID